MIIPKPVVNDTELLRFDQPQNSCARRDDDPGTAALLLIWNDLSTTNSVLSFFLHSFFFLQEASRVAIEEAITTIDHSDIRGSEPHNRDPSGAASD